MQATNDSGTNDSGVSGFRRLFASFKLPSLPAVRDLPPRDLSLRIIPNRDKTGYQLNVFLRRARTSLPLPLTKERLTGLLEQTRALMDGLRQRNVYADGGYDADGRYTGEFLGDEGAYTREKQYLSRRARRETVEAALQTMAQHGNLLYDGLFGMPAALPVAQEIETLLAPGASIEIRIDRQAGEFTYPWTLLYPEFDVNRRVNVDSDAFWGCRYVIEQIYETETTLRQKTARMPLSVSSLQMHVGAYNFHPTTRQQREFFTRCQHRSNGVLQCIFSDDPAHWENLLKHCDSPLLYFFTHGHTANLLMPAGAHDMGDDSMQHETYIRLQNGYLLQRKMQRWMQLGLGAPLVFLNMCESAQRRPYTNEDMVTLFLERGARTVIGTEIPMQDAFADLFARRFFERFFYGTEQSTRPLSAGETMRRLRRQFLERGNPFGFAYTLYGDAGVCLASGLPFQ